MSVLIEPRERDGQDCIQQGGRGLAVPICDWLGRPRQVVSRAMTAIWVVCCQTAYAAETISGVPRILDGDTVEIGETKIRLGGIDAPETDQVCLDDSGKAWNCGIVVQASWSKAAQARTRLAFCSVETTPDGNACCRSHAGDPSIKSGRQRAH